MTAVVVLHNLTWHDLGNAGRQLPTFCFAHEVRTRQCPSGLQFVYIFPSWQVVCTVKSHMLHAAISPPDLCLHRLLCTPFHTSANNCKHAYLNMAGKQLLISTFHRLNGHHVDLCLITPFLCVMSGHFGPPASCDSVDSSWFIQLPKRLSKSKADLKFLLQTLK